MFRSEGRPATMLRLDCVRLSRERQSGLRRIPESNSHLNWKLRYRKEPSKSLTNRILPKTISVPTYRYKTFLTLKLIGLLQPTLYNRIEYLAHRTCRHTRISDMRILQS